MLYIFDGGIEQCAADKETIRGLCPHVWIHWVLSGKGYYNEQSLTRGQGFITYTCDYHEYRPDPKDPWKYAWILLAGEDTENLLQKCNFPQQSGIFHFSYEEDLLKLQMRFFPHDTCFLEILNENRVYAEALCKLYLSLNLRETNSEADGAQKWVQKAKQYIRSNYHKNLKIEDVAKSINIDRKYLRNLFVKYTGMSSQQYLINVRIRHAKELLKKTEAGIDTIARSVGYSDTFGFSKAFKKATGVSPTAYRKSHRTPDEK